MRSDIRARVRAFIDENFLYRDDTVALADADSLLESGLVDSTGVLELVSFVEDEFQLHMADDEIVPENLDSVQAIAAYIERKTQPAGAAA